MCRRVVMFLLINRGSFLGLQAPAAHSAEERLGHELTFGSLWGGVQCISSSLSAGDTSGSCLPLVP